ncbi:hypothetical protein CCY99_01915 [Helicobacter sp. 16-1353]|uniref:hypothetical protein n=1 Tax=Helicobacter sp. 16-1353 TaxID=2004996 RepID=UPI000DCCA3B6|nr:hypothetical protein [Helicobacter sp. 16-1353]RAX54923.1 hypothetical protein CCY99_01915 [Helicobacter sp. 16-1353]
MKFEITKKMWMKIHTYLSLFFLPAAFIYVLTGVLYIFDFKQDSGAKIYEFKLESAPKKGEELEAIIKVLSENNLKIPSNTELKSGRNSVIMGNTKYQISLTQNNNGAVVKVTDRSIYGILVLMHKAKGEKNDVFGFKISFFDLIAIGFGLSMVIFYLSGLIMTSFCKKNRKFAFRILFAGLIITIIAMYFSV